MCLLCIEIQKKTMTVREVAKAFQEFQVPDGHNGEILSVIDDNYGIEPVAKELNEILKDKLAKAFTGGRT